jgi:hypothetical protein
MLLVVERKKAGCLFGSVVHIVGLLSLLSVSSIERVRAPIRETLKAGNERLSQSRRSMRKCDGETQTRRVGTTKHGRLPAHQSGVIRHKPTPESTFRTLRDARQDPANLR